MEIKTRYIVIALILSHALFFFVGFRTNGFSTNKRIAELAESGSDIQAELEDERRRNGEITDGLRWSARENRELTEGLRELAESNRPIAPGIGSVRQGIAEDWERLSGLYDEIGSYLDKPAE